MKVSFNPMVSSNKVQNISSKGKPDRIKEVRDTEKYLKDFNKNGCKGKISDYVNKRLCKVCEWFDLESHKHPLRVNLTVLGIALSGGILGGLALNKLTNPLYYKYLCKEYAPQEFDRISGISDKNERTISYQEAADSIKCVHSKENTDNAIKIVILSNPEKAVEIIDKYHKKSVRDEEFRKEADNIIKQY